MSVFRNYNTTKAGGVNANAFPRVHTIPWVPTQRNVRSNPNIPTQPQRIQPHERGTFFPTSASGGGTLAPDLSSGGCGCAGCNGNMPGGAPPTASSQSTGHAFPVKGTALRGGTSTQPTPTTKPGFNIAVASQAAARTNQRGTGSIRQAPRAGAIFKSTSTSGAVSRPMGQVFMGGRMSVR